MAVKPYLQCEICDKDFSGPEPYAQHCVSKAHLKKASEVEATRSPSPLPYAPAGQKLRCNDCQIDLSGPTPMQQHLEGSKHKAMINKRRIINEQGVVVPPVSDIPRVLKCGTCDKGFSGPESYEQHMVSKKHQRKMELGDLKNRLTTSGAASCPPMFDHPAEMTREGRLYPALPTPARPGYPTRAEAEKEPKTRSTGCFSGLKRAFSMKKKTQTPKE